MVASGVASKGLDFNDIQHVIIFSMPKEIEDYVHQIGRTGRSGKTGIATAFVNMNTPEQTLLDLKYLLMEAGQKWVSLVWLAFVTNDTFAFLRVPPFLQTIDDPRMAQGASLKGCPVCGGRTCRHIFQSCCSRSIRFGTWHLELSKVGGCPTAPDGFPESCTRWWWWLLKLEVSMYCIDNLVGSLVYEGPAK